MPQRKVDMVSHPPHYSNPNKKLETIDKIEDAVQFAPDPVLGGLQWQVLKVHGQALVERKSQAGCPKSTMVS
jgi:hypothetical protein